MVGEGEPRRDKELVLELEDAEGWPKAARRAKRLARICYVSN